MLIPATRPIPQTHLFGAVWKDRQGQTRYTISLCERTAWNYKDARDGWEPFVLTAHNAGAAAYMATRDADKPGTVEALEKWLRAEYKTAKTPTFEAAMFMEAIKC